MIAFNQIKKVKDWHTPEPRAPIAMVMIILLAFGLIASFVATIGEGKEAAIAVTNPEMFTIEQTINKIK